MLKGLVRKPYFVDVEYLMLWKMLLWQCVTCLWIPAEKNGSPFPWKVLLQSLSTLHSSYLHAQLHTIEMQIVKYTLWRKFLSFSLLSEKSLRMYTLFEIFTFSTNCFRLCVCVTKIQTFFIQSDWGSSLCFLYHCFIFASFSLWTLSATKTHSTSRSHCIWATPPASYCAQYFLWTRPNWTYPFTKNWCWTVWTKRRAE